MQLVAKVAMRSARHTSELNSMQRLWILEAFNRLCGGETLCPKRLRGFTFRSWLRAFLMDMRLRGNLPLQKAVSTSCLVALLAARAETGPTGALTSDEFIAMASVIMRPSAACALEGEVTWALLDTARAGEINAELLREAQSLWATCGVVCTSEDIERCIAAAIAEDGVLTAERYHELFTTCCGEKRPRRHRPCPSSSRGSCGKQIRAAWQVADNPSQTKDSIQKSREVAGLSIFSDGIRMFPLAQHRDLQATYATQVSRVLGQPQAQGGATLRNTANDDAKRQPGLQLPKVVPAKQNDGVDWVWQEEVLAQREARLQPYQRVNVEYVTPNGTKVKSVGTLMNGWGLPNQMVDVPHSRPPSQRSADRSKFHEPDNARNCVVVSVHGVDKVVPRGNVTPLDNYPF